MAAPGNEDEFVTLFFDDQSDLGDWVRASCPNAVRLSCIIPCITNCMTCGDAQPLLTGMHAKQHTSSFCP